MTHSKLSLSSLYMHAGSFVPSQQSLEDPRLTNSTDALSEQVDHAAHLDRLKRERRATAPVGKPRSRSKLDEALERADASFVRLSVTDLVSSPYSAPFTLGDDRETHEARRAAGRASFSSNLSAAPTTTSPSTPRTPISSAKAAAHAFVHAAPYLHDDPAGVAKVSPHFEGEIHKLHTARPTLAAWSRQHLAHKSAPADQARAMVRNAAKASTRATTEQLADHKLREECIAMLRAEANRPARPAPKKPSRLASLLESVKSKTTSRVLAVKRALRKRSGFR